MPVLPVAEQKPYRRLLLPSMRMSACLFFMSAQPSCNFGLGQDPAKLRLLREEAGMNLTHENKQSEHDLQQRSQEATVQDSRGA